MWDAPQHDGAPTRTVKPHTPHPTPFGFTLVELLVALTLASLVVLLAHRLFAAATEAARTVQEARAALDREANARRWLQAAALSVDVGQQAGDGFEGRPGRLSFSTWLEAPDGWFARRRVALGQDAGSFVAVVDQADTIALMTDADAVAFDYLLEPGADTKWVREWISPVSAPLAIRLRVERRTGDGGRVDTLLLLVKERG
jgi:prepilin-type N-terminal cleavage/methylation domain-containing protein